MLVETLIAERKRRRLEVIARPERECGSEGEGAREKPLEGHAKKIRASVVSESGPTKY